MVNDQQKGCLLGYSQADGALVYLPTPTTIVVENQALCGAEKETQY